MKKYSHAWLAFMAIKRIKDKESTVSAIRYLPLYDKEGNYKGIIEVSQDVRVLRALKGEKRLLD